MAIVSLTCQKCGASLKFDDSRKFAFCDYCGEKVIITPEIKNIIYNTNIRIERGNKEQLCDMLNAAEQAIDIGDYDTSMKIVDDLLLIDPTFAETYRIKLKIEQKRQYERFTETNNGEYSVLCDYSNTLGMYNIYSDNKMSMTDFMKKEFGMDISCSSISSLIYDKRMKKGCIELERLMLKISDRILYRGNRSKDNMMRIGPDLNDLLSLLRGIRVNDQKYLSKALTISDKMDDALDRYTNISDIDLNKVVEINALLQTLTYITKKKDRFNLLDESDVSLIKNAIAENSDVHADGLSSKYPNSFKRGKDREQWGRLIRNAIEDNRRLIASSLRSDSRCE